MDDFNKKCARELQEKLVECCVEYFKNNPNKDVDEVYFHIDSLQASIEFGKWHPYSDSTIDLCQNTEDGRKFIANYC